VLLDRPSGSRTVTRQAIAKRRLRARAWLATALLALVVAGVGVWLATRGSSPPQADGPGPRPSATTTVPGRPLFFFPIDLRHPAATGKDKQAASDDATVAIAARLSTFYDTVFANPETWANGVPDGAWSLFDRSVADRAKKDADAFTLGDRATGLAELKVKDATLAVKVLLDPSGQADAAIAEVEFVAVGTMQDGQKIDITNHVSFLLQPEGGQWAVVGYPSASTDVQARTAPSPSAGPSGSATP
jgi:hypothetical protein